MKFLIVVVACCLYIQTDASDESQENASFRSREVGEEIDRPAKFSLNGIRDENEDASVERRDMKRPAIITYDDANRELQAEAEREKKSRESAEKQDNGEEDDEDNYTDGQEPTVYENKRSAKKLQRSHRSHAVTMAGSDSESSRKRQQLLFGLNYVKGMMDDPHVAASLHSSTRQKFGKQMHRLESEVKSAAWDELYNQHLKKRRGN